jgi:hypothetical protein
VSVRGVKLIDLDFSSLRELPLDGSEVEKYRDEFRGASLPLVRARVSRYSGRVLVLDEASRCIAEAARLEGRDQVLAAIEE